MGSTFDSEYFNGNLQFANYLFNPLNPVEDNPPGVPGAVLDLMLVLQLAIIGLGWKGRKALKPATNKLNQTPRARLHRNPTGSFLIADSAKYGGNSGAATYVEVYATCA